MRHAGPILASRHSASLYAPAVAVMALWLAAGLSARPAAVQTDPRSPPPSGEGGVRALHVQGNVWMIQGAGGNIAVQAGGTPAGVGAGDGVLLVDTGRREMTSQVLAQIRKISPKRIEYIINTSGDPDHVGGNEAFAKPTMDFLWTPGTVTGPGVKVVAHEGVLARMTARGDERGTPYPTIAQPSSTYFANERPVYFNDEGVVVMHQPAAHGSGDSMVFFRRSDVISAGDVFLMTTYPVIDRDDGGTLAGIIGGLNRLLDLMIPRYNQEGGTYVIPGHGRIGDQHDVLEYRDMLVIVRDRIQHGVRAGLSLDQVKASRPTLDYDARWGASTAPWTTDQFVAAVYSELAGSR
jgi:glyoxylase-like metal-dependent hydrolase (beta-lactamase superfamily II)